MVLVSYEDIEEIYEEIKQAACGRQACSVLIMVAYEIDAMASSRIFTQLLRRDNVAYTVRPVINFVEMEYNFKSITSDIKSIILFNCGGVTNIDKTFNLCFGGDVRCYIFDNHRPIHLANIYSTYNVVVFMDPSEMDKAIPSDNSDVSSFDEAESDSDEEPSVASSDEDYDEGQELDEEEQAQAEHTKSQLENDEEAENEEEEDNDENGESEDVAASDDDVGEEVANNEDDEKHSEEEESEDDNKEEEEGDDSEGSDADIEDDKSDEEEEKEEDEHPNAERNEEGTPEEEEEGDGEEEEVRVIGKKRKRSEAERLAKDRKDRLERYYKGNVVHATPTAMMLVVLVIGRCGSNIPIDLLWQAILGVTDQYFRDNLSESIYNDCCDKLRFQLGDHIESSSDRVRYSVGDEANANEAGVGGGVVSVPGSENGHIQDGQEFRFFLYRHWSLLESMSHSSYVASKLSVYSTKESKLNEMLAKMGIPLSECKQSFQFMTPELRNHFFQQIGSDAIVSMYGLSNPSVTFKSFYRYNSFKNSISAADVVVASSVLLDSYDRRKSRDTLSVVDQASVIGVMDGAVTNSSIGSDSFYEAYSCLSRFSDDVLKKGVNNALLIQKILVKKAMVLIDSRDSIIKYNRIYVAHLRRASGIDNRNSGNDFEQNELQYPFERPSILSRLGQFIMNVKMNMPKKDGGWIGSVLLPLILVSELHDDTFLVMGISPLASMTGNEEVITEEHLDKLLILTNFRMFFKQAAKDINVSISHSCFDANAIVVGKNDVQDFLGTLDYCLKKATPVKF